MKGDRAQVYRPTWGANADKTRIVASYGTPVLPEIKVFLDGITDELVRKVFGGSELVDTRGFVGGTPNIKSEDRIRLTSGPRSGAVFRVESVRPQYGRHLAHYELALQSTTETIP